MCNKLSRVTHVNMRRIIHEEVNHDLLPFHKDGVVDFVLHYECPDIPTKQERYHSAWDGKPTRERASQEHGESLFLINNKQLRLQNGGERFEQTRHNLVLSCCDHQQEAVGIG